MASAREVIFCTGVMRSGSTWSFNVCRMLAQLIGKKTGRPHAAFYARPSEVDDILTNGLENLPGPCVIKVHQLNELGLGAILAGAVRVVATHRDPRDCVASLMKFENRSIETAVEGIRRNFEQLERYALQPNVMVLRYDRIMADAGKSVKEVGAFLGMGLQPGLIETLVKMAGSEEGQKVAQGLKEKEEKAVLMSGSHRVDPVTSLHDNHFQGGKTGRWKEELTEEQKNLCGAVLARYVERWGYDLKPN